MSRRTLGHAEFYTLCEAVKKIPSQNGTAYFANDPELHKLIREHLPVDFEVAQISTNAVKKAVATVGRSELLRGKGGDMTTLPRIQLLEDRVAKLEQVIKSWTES